MPITEETPTKVVTCPRCSRTVAITPHVDLMIDKRELNAGHAMVLGSTITCGCGKVL